jgi:hypothetical protein
MGQNLCNLQKFPHIPQYILIYLLFVYSSTCLYRYRHDYPKYGFPELYIVNTFSIYYHIIIYFFYLRIMKKNIISIIFIKDNNTVFV